MLQEQFELLAEAYEEDPEGKSLISLLREDWAMFPVENIQAHRAKDLLAEIFDDGNINRRNFKALDDAADPASSLWEQLRQELRHENRWFLSHPIDVEWLRSLLPLALAGEVPPKWYRARLQKNGEQIPLDRMGAPPRELSSHGRANPAGIPYLYLGSDPTTSISEVRPHTGDIACVAEFELDDVTVVDLRWPRKIVSPFIPADVVRLRGDVAFLERLGKELMRPVLPHSSAFDYVPSQYLCEFIKSASYDGVLYRSAVGSGTNLALFNTEKANAISRSEYEVSKVSVASVPKA